jgi:hypothetical protein
LIKPYTKAVIVEPYYEQPSWLRTESERPDLVILSRDSRPEEVEWFLVLLFGYNDIEVACSFDQSFAELFAREGVTLSGGVAFMEGERAILPSCCCGLESFEEIYESVCQRTSPWLGHDPSPGILYPEAHVAKVWSNDQASPGEEAKPPYSITFEYKDLLHSLEAAREDLRGFIRGPLYRWISQRDLVTGQEMIRKLESWFRLAA